MPGFPQGSFILVKMDVRLTVNAGLARAKAEGKTLGRPKTSTDTEQAIIQSLAKGGKGMQKIAKEFGVGTSVVQRLAKAEAT